MLWLGVPSQHRAAIFAGGQHIVSKTLWNTASTNEMHQNVVKSYGLSNKSAKTLQRLSFLEGATGFERAPESALWGAFWEPPGGA